MAAAGSEVDTTELIESAIDALAPAGFLAYGYEAGYDNHWDGPTRIYRRVGEVQYPQLPGTPVLGVDFGFHDGVWFFGGPEALKRIEQVADSVVGDPQDGPTVLTVPATTADSIETVVILTQSNEAAQDPGTNALFDNLSRKSRIRIWPNSYTPY